MFPIIYSHKNSKNIKSIEYKIIFFISISFIFFFTKFVIETNKKDISSNNLK